LFVALVSYEDKLRLAQHWSMHNRRMKTWWRQTF